MPILNKLADYRNRLAGWFVDREFFMRSNGQIRFIKISGQLQRRVASGFAAVVGLWLMVTAGMAVNQASISFERMTLVQKEAKVQSAAQRVSAYRDSIDEVTNDLKRRQDMLESMTAPLLGKETTNDAPVKNETAKKISAAIPEAAALAEIEGRQIIFAERMTKMAKARTARAEIAIRQFGLNPDAMAGSHLHSGLGGPFIPFFSGPPKKISDPRFDRLADAIERMSALENALARVPTSMPAAAGLRSSGYGYRRDPFTGAGAMHSGIDFKAPLGTAILAAASGKVTYAGYQGGYGKTVEVTHANGLITRYAHLSDYSVSLGEWVGRGIQIGRMGSTGRSTGSHLHFEVRLNSRAMNPLKFLEANSNVLKSQTLAGAKYSTSAERP